MNNGFVTGFEGYILTVFHGSQKEEPKPETAFYGDMWNAKEGIYIYRGKEHGWILEIPRDTLGD